MESGYNDGIISPVFLFALILAGSTSQAHTPMQALGTAVPFAAKALAVGMGLTLSQWGSVVIFVAAVAIRSLLFAPFSIPTGSNIPLSGLGSRIVTSMPWYLPSSSFFSRYDELPKVRQKTSYIRIATWWTKRRESARWSRDGTRAFLFDAGDTALFFGLSGTGKTTLSADPERHLHPVGQVGREQSVGVARRGHAEFS